MKLCAHILVKCQGFLVFAKVVSTLDMKRDDNNTERHHSYLSLSKVGLYKLMNEFTNIILHTLNGRIINLHNRIF